MFHYDPVSRPIPTLELYLDPEKVLDNAESQAGKVIDICLYSWHTNIGKEKAIRFFGREIGNLDRQCTGFIERDSEEFQFCSPLADRNLTKFTLKVKLVKKDSYTDKSGQPQNQWRCDVMPLKDQHEDVLNFYKPSQEELQAKADHIKDVIARNNAAREQAEFENSGKAEEVEVKPVEVVTEKSPSAMKTVSKKPNEDFKSPKLKTSIIFDSPEQAVACYRGVEDIRDLYPKMPQGRILAMAAFIGMKQLKQYMDVSC